MPAPFLVTRYGRRYWTAVGVADMAPPLKGRRCYYRITGKSSRLAAPAAVWPRGLPPGSFGVALRAALGPLQGLPFVATPRAGAGVRGHADAPDRGHGSGSYRAQKRDGRAPGPP